MLMSSIRTWWPAIYDGDAVRSAMRKLNLQLPTEFERDRVSPALLDSLRARGHVIRLADQTSGLQGVMRAPAPGDDGWIGAADPRREGLAEGD